MLMACIKYVHCIRQNTQNNKIHHIISSNYTTKLFTPLNTCHLLSKTHSSSSSGFYPTNVRSPVQIALPHSALSIASSSVFPITFKSSRTQSSHLRFGRPLVLLPVSHFLILLPTYSSFLLTTCPSHLSLVSLSLSLNFPTNIFLSMSSFFTLSSFVFPTSISAFSFLLPPFFPPVSSSLLPFPLHTSLLVVP